jgi:hypothetical protein
MGMDMPEVLAGLTTQNPNLTRVVVVIAVLKLEHTILVGWK